MMAQNSEDLAAFQKDIGSKGRCTFGFGGLLELNFLSSQLPFPPVPHLVQLSHQYQDLYWTALSSTVCEQEA